MIRTGQVYEPLQNTQQLFKPKMVFGADIKILSL